MSVQYALSMQAPLTGMLASLPDDLLLERIITQLLIPDPRLISINRWWRTVVTENEELWRRALLARFSMFRSLAIPPGSLVAGTTWREIYRRHALIEAKSAEFLYESTNVDGFLYQLSREEMSRLCSDITPVVDSRLSSFIFTFRLFDGRDGHEALLVSWSGTISSTDFDSIQICAPEDIPELYRWWWNAELEAKAEFRKYLRLEILVTHQFETFMLTSTLPENDPSSRYDIFNLWMAENWGDVEYDHMVTSLLMSLAIDEDADLAEDGIIVTMWFIEEGDSPWNRPEEARIVALLQALRRAESYVSPHHR